MASRPSWLKASRVHWEERVSMWNLMARGESDTWISERTQETTSPWHRNVIADVRKELRELPQCSVLNLSPEIQDYWKQLQGNRTDNDSSPTVGIEHLSLDMSRTKAVKRIDELISQYPDADDDQIAQAALLHIKMELNPPHVSSEK